MLLFSLNVNFDYVFIRHVSVVNCIAAAYKGLAAVHRKRAFLVFAHVITIFHLSFSFGTNQYTINVNETQTLFSEKL